MTAPAPQCQPRHASMRQSYRDFSDMPDDALRSLAADLAEVGRIGWAAFKRNRRAALNSGEPK